MSYDEVEIPISKRIFDRANRAYRVAARIQYTLLSTVTINYDEDVIGAELEDLIDSLHDAALELDNAVEILKGIED